jgi:hypothetical protein
MHRVDVGPQPVEQREVFGRAAQQTAVHVAVVEAGDKGVAGEVDALGLDLAEPLDRADRRDHTAVDQYRTRLE